METLSVRLDVPRNFLGALDMPEPHLETKLRELIALELVREAVISTGKAAEFLGVPKFKFVQLMAQHGVSYFSETPEELDAQLEVLERIFPKLML